MNTNTNTQMVESAANPFPNTMQPSSTGNAAAGSDQQRAIATVQAAMVRAITNPRNQRTAMARILEACNRPTLADAAIYTYAKGGTSIEGPSIRLAEAIAQQWGNIRFGINELEQGETESTVQSYAWDLETNTYREITFVVSHVRHTKTKTYTLTDPRDIYENMANNASRRLRACILAVIPGDVIEQAVEQCGITMRIKADVSPEAMQKMVDAFREFGVSKEMIEKRIQRSIKAIQPANVVSLKKIYASLRDGMSEAAEWFDMEVVSEQKKQLPEYPADQFAANLPKWKKQIEGKKQTAGGLVAVLSGEYLLSKEQMDQIAALTPKADGQSEGGAK